MTATRVLLIASLVLTAALAMAGCATTRVDVDVYKGPLANHEDVQVQQLAVMANAAKPLLLYTLEYLERRNDRDFTIDAKDPQILEALHKQDLKNGQAQRVYAILTLYSDLAPPVLSRLLTEGKAAIDELNRTNAILRASTPEEKGKDAEVRELLKAAAGHRDPNAALRAAYIEYLTAGEKGWRKIPDLLTPEVPTEGHGRANAMFRVMQNRDKVNADAEVLFGAREGVQKERFISRVTEIADAYFKMREQIEKLMVLALTTLDDLNRERLSGDRTKEREFGSMAEEIARLAASTIDPDRLQEALNAREISASAQRLKRVLPSREATEADDGEYRQIILDALTNPSHSYARDLLELNSDYRRDDNSSKAQHFRDFGLAAGRGERIVNVKRILDAFARCAAYFGSGLEHGRTASGLETLSDEYQRALEAHDSKDPQTFEKRRLLLDALVAFAEKVLFLANNETILGKQHVSSTQQTSCQDNAAPPVYSDRGLDRYILMLQDVGNSILVQADELRHRETHKEKQKDAEFREERGLALAVATDPRETLDTLLNETEASLTGATANVKDITTKIEETKKKLTELGAKLQGVSGDLKTPKDSLDKAKADVKAAQEKEAFYNNALKILNDTKFAEGIEGLKAEKKKAKEVLEFVKAALAGEIAKEPVSPVSDRAKSLLDAQKVVLELGDGADLKPADDSTSSVFKSIGTAVKAKANDAHKQALDGQMRVEQLDPVCKDGSGKEKGLQDEKKKLEDEIAKLEKEKMEAEAAKQELADALSVFRKLRDQVIAGLQEASNPKLVLGKLKDLAQSLSKSADDEYAHAVAVLRKTPASVSPGLSGMDIAAMKADAKSSKDVLDELIAALREQHVAAISQWGKNSVKAHAISDALEAAYAHRSGMVYIRPASAYLRTSYAATTLQQKPNIGWENMLSGQAGRNMPLIGQAWENCRLGNSGEKGRIISELDKQFWQTINSVRVSGVGKTNYAIVKDDIGNWYVKGYSADPEPVIKGAQSLAMFSLGGAMGTDLLGRLKTGGAPTAAMMAETSQTPFAKLVRKYEADYMTTTNTDLENLSSLLKPASTDEKADYACPLGDTITKGWQSIEAIKADTALTTALAGALKTAAESQLKPAYDMLNKGLVDAETVSGTAKLVQAAIAKGPNAAMSPLLDPIIKKLANPARINRIATLLMQQVELNADADLKNNLGKLKQSIGVEEPGQKIVNALQAMRRFHNQLTAAIAGINFTTDGQTALDAAKKDVAVAETKLAAAQADKDKADTALTNAEDDLKNAQAGANTQALNDAVSTANTNATNAKAALDAAKTALDNANTALKDKQGALNGATEAQKAASGVVTNMMREKLNEFIDKRLAAVKTLEKAVTFVGDVNSQ